MFFEQVVFEARIVAETIGRNAFPFFECVFWSAPIGKELVIEFLSIDLFADSGVLAYPPRLAVPQGGSQELYFFPLPQQIDDGSEAVFVGVHQTRLYVAPSGEVQLHCALSRSVSFGACDATISGYLVEAP